jgi:hypothetical protein
MNIDQETLFLIQGRYADPLERTNRSRLNHLEFLGLALTKLKIRMVLNTIECLDIVYLTARRVRGSPGPCPWVRLSIRVVVSNQGAIATTGGVPGWPEFAFPTTSTARVRMVAIATSSAWWGAKADMVVEERDK